MRSDTVIKIKTGSYSCILELPLAKNFSQEKQEPINVVPGRALQYY